MSNLVAWSLILMAAVNSTLGNILLKKSSGDEITSITNLAFNYHFLGGLFFYGVSVLFFSRGLMKLPVSVAYPVLASLGFIMLSIGADLFLGEKLALHQWCGIGVILVGITLLTHT